jgi:hypothetical protein
MPGSRVRLVYPLLTCVVLLAAGSGMAARGATPITDVYLKPAATISPDGSSDLDGDGRADLIEVAYRYKTTRFHGLESVTFTVRRGFDGHVLWSLTDSTGNSPPTNSWAVVRLGKPARPGLLVTYPSLAAYDGRTGAMLWHKKASGLAVLPSSRGRAAQVLTRDSLSRPVVVSGKDGSEHLAGNPSLDDNQQVALGDLDHDGLADFALLSTLVNQLTMVYPQWIEARSSATGRTLWKRTWSSGRLTAVQPTSDATGDGAADLIVKSFDANIIYSDHLLSGSTGHNALDVPNATDLWAIGDVNGDGRTDIAAMPYDRTDRVEVRAATNGTVLWRRVLPAFGNTGATDLGPTGDINADRVQDLAVGEYRGTTSQKEEFINGRTGAAAIRAWPGEPLRAAVDGAGDDFAYVDSADGKAWYLTATDGRTGARLFKLRVPGFGFGDLTAGDLTGDGKAEVLDYYVPIDRTGPDGTIVVIDGATHTQLWSSGP